MTELQEQVLLALTRLKEPIKARDLAAKMNLTTRQVSATLKGLGDRGCVSKVGIKDWSDRGPHSFQMTRSGLTFLLDEPEPGDRDAFHGIDQKWRYKLLLRLRHDHGLMMASESRFDYGPPGEMDEECVRLCDALNCIPGIRTFESCCGHGLDPFQVWMTAESVNSLYILTKAINPIDDGPIYLHDPGDADSVRSWSLEVQNTDTQDMPVIFHLHSDRRPPHNLKMLIRQADTISLHIHDFFVMATGTGTPPAEDNP